MPSVETVNGPIDVEELGRTLIHEHFRTTDEAMRFQFHTCTTRRRVRARHGRRSRRQGTWHQDGRRSGRDVPAP